MSHPNNDRIAHLCKATAAGAVPRLLTAAIDRMVGIVSVENPPQEPETEEFWSDIEEEGAA